jgi:hypothetical protein
MRLGINIKIDVTKIEKARLFKGEKGTYLELSTFIDTEDADQYGNHGFISQSVSKEEREQGVKTPILGNSKVFFTGESNKPESSQGHGSNAKEGDPDIDEEDIPF